MATLEDRWYSINIWWWWVLGWGWGGGSLRNNREGMFVYNIQEKIEIQ
jgi:hypothetical protein